MGGRTLCLCVAYVVLETIQATERKNLYEATPLIERLQGTVGSEVMVISTIECSRSCLSDPQCTAHQYLTSRRLNCVLFYGTSDVEGTPRGGLDNNGFIYKKGQGKRTTNNEVHEPVYGSSKAAPNMTFTLHEELVSWSEARVTCEGQGQRLAVLDTVAKRNSLKEQLPSSPGLFPWIGFHDAYNNNTYYWINGEPVAGNWKPGEPHRGIENCGYFGHDILFHDFRCDSLDYFVCEKFRQ